MATYSPSKLAVYKECPLKYRFVFIDGIRKLGNPIEAFTGLRVHETLQELVDARANFGKDLGFEKASTIFHRKWEENYNECVVIRNEQLAADDYKAKGLEHLEKFFEIEAGRQPAEVVGLEKRIGFMLEECFMKGFIDRLERRGNNFYIIDYKATDYPYTQEQADADWQLGIYELAVRGEFPEAEEVTLIWFFLGPGLIVSSTRSAEQRKELRNEIRALINEIENASEFPPTENRYCFRCDYNLECAEENRQHKESVVRGDYG